MTSLSTAAKGMVKFTIFFRRRWARSFVMDIVQDEDVEQRLTEDTVINEKKGTPSPSALFTRADVIWFN